MQAPATTPGVVKPPPDAVAPEKDDLAAGQDLVESEAQSAAPEQTKSEGGSGDIDD